MTGSVVPPTTISDEAVEAAARAIYDSCWEDSTPDTLAAWELISEQERREFIEQARAAVAAVVPYIEAGLRAKIAAEIEADGREVVQFLAGDETREGRCRLIGAEDAYKDAMRVARGTQEATNG